MLYYHPLQDRLSFLFLLGRYIRPSSTSGTIFITCWLFVALVITTTYSANLIAFLSVEKYTVPFNTLQELASQDQYKFGTLGGTAQMLHVKASVICNYWNAESFKKNFQAIRSIQYFVTVCRYHIM